MLVMLRGAVLLLLYHYYYIEDIPFMQGEGTFQRHVGGSPIS